MYGRRESSKNCIQKRRFILSKDIVSIVIPVYNVEAFICDTISSVVNQTYQDWELILVDDCSTDQSMSIVNTYREELLGQKRIEMEQIHTISLEQNKGAYYARNIGVNEAKGRYICFLDSDDLWKPEKLNLQIEFMKETKAAFSFTAYEFADEGGNGTGKVANVPKTLYYKQALKNTIIFTSTVMFDLTKISKESIQMPNIPSEDTATWWTILKSGYQAYGLDEVLTFYRRSKGTLSSNKWQAICRIWNLYRKIAELNVIQSAYYFCHYSIRATIRRL